MILACLNKMVVSGQILMVDPITAIDQLRESHPELQDIVKAITRSGEVSIALFHINNRVM